MGVAASEILARDKALSGTEPKQPEIIAAVPRYWPPQYGIDGEGQADQIVQPLNVGDAGPREDRDNKCLNGGGKAKGRRPVGRDAAVGDEVATRRMQNLWAVQSLRSSAGEEICSGQQREVTDDVRVPRTFSVRHPGLAGVANLPSITSCTTATNSRTPKGFNRAHVAPSFFAETK